VACAALEGMRERPRRRRGLPLLHVVPQTHHVATPIPSRRAYGVPLSGAELAEVERALIVFVGTAEHRGPRHVPVGDDALEAIGDDAALVARGEVERDGLPAQGAGGGTRDLRRRVLAGQRRPLLPQMQPMRAGAVQEGDAELPFPCDVGSGASARSASTAAVFAASATAIASPTAAASPGCKPNGS